MAPFMEEQDGLLNWQRDGINQYGSLTKAKVHGSLGTDKSGNPLYPRSPVEILPVQVLGS